MLIGGDTLENMEFGWVSPHMLLCCVEDGSSPSLLCAVFHECIVVLS